MRSSILCIYHIILYSGLFLPFEVYADSKEDRARAYFDNKEYQACLDIWHDVLTSGKMTVGIYYNIGVAESRLGHTPEAILAFEKALRFKPSSKVIRNAIQKEKERIENGVIPVKPFFLAQWYRNFLAVFRPGYWGFFGLLFLITGILHFVVRNTRSAVGIHIPVRIDLSIVSIGLVFLMISILSFGSLYRANEAILHEVCDIRQAATEESPPLMTLHPGEKMIIIDQLSGWYNVRMQNLKEGWVRIECLTLIEMGTP